MENYTELLKEDISFSNISECCKKSVFLGLLFINGTLKRSNKEMYISLKFQKSIYFRKIQPILKDLNIKRSDVLCSYDNKNNLKSLHINVLEKEFEDHGLISMLFNQENIFGYLKKECCFKNFIKVCLLNISTIVNPSKQYFFEINMKNHGIIAEYVKERFHKELKINFKIRKRNEDFLLYLKKFEEIVTFLSYTSCKNIVLALEERSVIKSMRNKVNRDINCEISNMNRQISVGSDQAALFREIKESELFEELDQKSVDIIEIRVKNPIFSYAEIASELEMTKAQVSYYLKKIQRKYLKYKTNLIKS